MPASFSLLPKDQQMYCTTRSEWWISLEDGFLRQSAICKMLTTNSVLKWVSTAKPTSPWSRLSTTNTLGTENLCQFIAVLSLVPEPLSAWPLNLYLRIPHAQTVSVFVAQG
jgi:hypothetical protein